MLEWTTDGRSACVRAALIAFVRFRAVGLLGRAMADQWASYSIWQVTQNRLRFGNAIAPQHRAPGSTARAGQGLQQLGAYPRSVS